MSSAQKRWQISLSNHRGFSVKISSLRDFTKLKKNKKCVYFWAINKEFYSGMFDERTFAGDFTLLVDLIRPYKYWYSMFCNCFVHSFLYWFYRFHLTHLYICLVFVLCLISHFVLQIFCLRLCIPRGFGIHWWTHDPFQTPKTRKSFIESQFSAFLRPSLRRVWRGISQV